VAIDSRYLLRLNLHIDRPFLERLGRRLDIDSVARGRRRGDNQEHHFFRRRVREAMLHPRRHMDPMASAESGGLICELQGRGTSENIKELVRTRVNVLDLARPRRNAFLYDAQAFMLEQMPPITDTAPDIMLCG